MGRDVLRTPDMNTLWQDVRFGIRSLRKDYGFLVACVTALGLGIGSATAIFSVIDSVMLHPFPYTNSERIYGFEIDERNSKEAVGRNYFSVPEFLDYQQQNRIFTDTMGVWETTSLMGSGERLEPLDTDTVTDNAFQFLEFHRSLAAALSPAMGSPARRRCLFSATRRGPANSGAIRVLLAAIFC